MTHLAKITAVEAKLLFREPGTWIIGMLLPALVLIAVGIIFAPHTPEAELGGRRYIDLLAPSMIVISLATLGISTLPARLVKYRELGVLRRLSTTPVEPAGLLVAQLIVNVAIAVAGLIVVIAVGNLLFQIPLPQHVPGFVAAFLLGVASLFAIGLLVAAVAPSTGVANALIWPIFIAVMFLGGVYFPRWLLPEVVVQIGDYTPPGVQAMLDAWLGTAPQLLPLVIMAAITIVAGAAAAKLFRWE
jgi:ABC-2 type transport system permease protein